MRLDTPRQSDGLGPFSRFVFYLLAASLGLATVAVAQTGNANIRLWQPLLLLLFAAIAGRALVRRGWRTKVAVGPAVLFVSVLFLSVLISGLSPLNQEIWIKQTILLAAMLFLFVVVATVDDSTALRRIAPVIAAAGTTICLYAMLEFFIDPEELQLYYSDGLLLPRIRGPFAEANEFSQYVTLPFAYVLALLAFAGGSRRRRALLLAAVLILVAGQGLSFSRGGVIAYAAAALVITYFYVRPNRHLQARELLLALVVFPVVMVLSILVLDPEGSYVGVLTNRILDLFSGSDLTADIRYQGIVTASSYLSSSYWYMFFGFGFGNLPFVLGPTIATTANFLIDLFVEAGVLAVASVLCLIVYLIAVSFAELKRHAATLDPALKAGYIGTLAAFWGLLCGGLTYATHMLNIFWFIAGLLLAFTRHSKHLAAVPASTPQSRSI